MPSSRKPGRNDPCPCGSGLKYKRCCLNRAQTVTLFTQQDRFAAFATIERFVSRYLEKQKDAAMDEFWDAQPDFEDELNEYQNGVSNDVFDMWFWFDRPLPDGGLVVDRLLRDDPPLSAGERRFLELIRGTCVRLYEVTDVHPGVSLTLRDVVGGGEVTVSEERGSRQLRRSDLLAARVISPGASGQPEMDAGLVPISGLLRKSVVSQLLELRADFRRRNQRTGDDAFFKQMPPFFHAAWLTSVFDPPIPHIQNTDGEDTLITRVHFDVKDADRLNRALDGAEHLAREEGSEEWTWSGNNRQGESVTLGRIELRDGTLMLEANSAERGERGRALIETLAGETVAHRGTSHEDLTQKLREAFRSGRAGEDLPSGDRDAAGEEIPFEVQEDLVLDHLARHYRKWIDEKVPMLDDRTPREAARDPARRSKVEELIRGLEGAYERSLRMNQPAYDPSWMWADLGFDGRAQPNHPPPLAHERWAEQVPGWAELCADVAKRVRSRPGFDDAATIVTRTELESDLDIRRFMKELVEQAGSAGEPSATRPSDLANQLRCAVNFELHRRKTFWVDESLAYMLVQTDLDITGDQLRLPFACLSLVFTDRHILSLAERLLASDRSCPLAGHILRLVTVYMFEEPVESGRRLHVALAADTRGADPPYLFEHDIDVRPGDRLDLDTVFSRHQVVLEGQRSPLPNRRPLPDLLLVVLNAVLYATSASGQPQLKASPRKGSKPSSGSSPVYSSEEVFFLPGSIPISQVRRLQELSRVPSGRKLTHRFMVRGHWRRPARTWKDKHVRWIEPYWKGPDLAAIIEKTYRMTP